MTFDRNAALVGTSFEKTTAAFSEDERDENWGRDATRRDAKRNRGAFIVK